MAESTSRPTKRHGGGLSKSGKQTRTLADVWTKKESASVFLTFTLGSGEGHGDGEEAEAEIDVGGAPAALRSELQASTSGQQRHFGEGKSGEVCECSKGWGAFYRVVRGEERAAVELRGAGH